MHPLIRFESALFDASGEPENPINPIFGYSLLEWLRTRIPELSLPEPEDWGWFSTIVVDEHCYLLGASGEGPCLPSMEWTLQVAKFRTRNPSSREFRLEDDDICLASVLAVLGSEPRIKDLAIEHAT